jgi:hypothetical protein
VVAANEAIVFRDRVSGGSRRVPLGFGPTAIVTVRGGCVLACGRNAVEQPVYQFVGTVGGDEYVFEDMRADSGACFAAHDRAGGFFFGAAGSSVVIGTRISSGGILEKRKTWEIEAPVVSIAVLLGSVVVFGSTKIVVFPLEKRELRKGRVELERPPLVPGERGRALRALPRPPSLQRAISELRECQERYAIVHQIEEMLTVSTPVTQTDTENRTAWGIWSSNASRIPVEQRADHRDNDWEGRAEKAALKEKDSEVIDGLSAAASKKASKRRTRPLIHMMFKD